MTDVANVGLVPSVRCEVETDAPCPGSSAIRETLMLLCIFCRSCKVSASLPEKLWLDSAVGGIVELHVAVEYVPPLLSAVDERAGSLRNCCSAGCRSSWRNGADLLADGTESSSSLVGTRFGGELPFAEPCKCFSFFA